MYAHILRRAAHVRRFTITPAPSFGWEVRDEVDSHVIKRRRYDDWHRVERARLTFAVEAVELRDAGWTEA